MDRSALSSWWPCTSNRYDDLPSCPAISSLAPPSSCAPMSRRTDYSNIPTGEQTLQDEETISGTGEGDEEMEDAEEQEEGYSACFFSRYELTLPLTAK